MEGAGHVCDTSNEDSDAGLAVGRLEVLSRGPWDVIMLRTIIESRLSVVIMWCVASVRQFLNR